MKEVCWIEGKNNFVRGSLTPLLEAEVKTLVLPFLGEHKHVESEDNSHLGESKYTWERVSRLG